MQKQLQLVREFHEKFQVPVLNLPEIPAPARTDLRHRLMQEEVAEYQEGVENADLPNIAKELADVMYAVLGTVLEHGLQDHFEAIFEEVHRSNMSKDFHELKMVKGSSYQPADVKAILEGRG